MASTLSPEGGAPRSALPLLDHRVHLTCRERTRTPVPVRTLGLLLLTLFVVLLAGLLFLPWQQFVRGTGRVIAYDPLERSLTVESPLTGRVETSLVVEGQQVRKGEVLFRLVDNDPNLLANLNLQKVAATARRDAARERIRSLDEQLGDQERALPPALEAARTRLDVARFAKTTAEAQYERVRALYQDERGLLSQREFELATLERDRTHADVLQAQALLERAEAELRGALNSSRAARESARADLASAEQSLGALSVQVNQADMQTIVAPRDGIVLRVQASEGTFLRAGSPLCVLVPATGNRMVELWMKGNDIPLIKARETDASGKILRRGSPVRLQFEGWPAIQFVGWPSVAVGTFGGEVMIIDATDNGKGMFRVLVVPWPDEIRHRDGSMSVQEWPGLRWLRQGVRVNGWVLLEQVPLWFEVWRQINGFPPALSAENGSFYDDN